MRGEYVVGWIKRGPSGVIGTNKKDASETVAKIVADAERGRARPDPGDRGCRVDRGMAAERAPQAVTWAGWRAIDEHERGLGEPHGRPRVKLVRLVELVAASRTGVTSR